MIDFIYIWFVQVSSLLYESIKLVLISHFEFTFYLPNFQEVFLYGRLSIFNIIYIWNPKPTIVIYEFHAQYCWFPYIMTFENPQMICPVVLF